MTSETIHIKLDSETSGKARHFGFNVSALCRKAVADAVQKIEKETRSEPSTAENRAVAPDKEDK